MLARIWCAVAIALALGPATAWADRPPPTPAQLTKARKAFEDGRKLHDAGKLTEAIEKFKASYELSRNPLLLYNIGLTMEELGSGDLAVIFYRKFLAEAAPDAAQRTDATDRIAAITRAMTPPEVAPVPVPTPTPVPEPAKPEPPRFGTADFTHRLVEAAPPGIPLDVTAIVSDGWTVAVMLFVRSAGDAAFTATPMERRNQEWVGRIAATRMTGSAVQYYVEVRDQGGALLARSGKSTSPNVINIDASVAPKFYPDFVPAPAAIGHRDGEDPIAAGTPGARGGPTGPAPDGVLDAGSRGFEVAKWSATAAAGTGVGLGITLYVLAHGHATAIEHDSTACGTPPCQPFDDYDRDLQRTGKLEQTISNVALIGGVAVAAVAGYFWYRELTASRRGDRKAARASPSRGSSTSSPTTASWQLAPALGSDGFTGAAAAGRF
jgi:hypothetical protein